MATYYVKNGGNDSADGSDDANAWETIAKVNSSGGAGNTILFKRGSVWRGEYITNSGGNTYGDYDSGSLPSIRGSALDATGTGWTEDGGEYHKTYAADPNIVVGDGTLLVRGTAGSLGAGEYAYSGGELYLKDNPTSFSALEVATVDRAFDWIWWDNVTIQNIDFRHFREIILNSFGDATGWTISGCSFGPTAKGGIQWNGNNTDAAIAIDNCTFTDWGVLAGATYAVQVISSAGSTGVLLDVTNSTFTINHTQNLTDIGGIYGDDYNALRNVKDNVITNASGSGAAFKGHGILMWKPGGRTQSSEISGNRLYNIGGIPLAVQAIEQYSGEYTILVRDNYIENGNWADNADEEGLRIMDVTSASDITVAYNIVNGTYDGAQTHDGIRCKGADAVKIYNNVVYAADDGFKAAPNAADNSINLDLRNNLFITNRGYGANFEADQTAATFDYNGFNGNSSGAVNGIEAGGNDVTSDPLVVNAAGGDFRLGAGSPCINAGTNVSLTTDYAGKPVGASPDIGAYEWLVRKITRIGTRLGMNLGVEKKI